MESGHGVTVRRSNRSVGTSPPLDCLPVWGGDGRFVLRSAVNERRSVLGAFCDIKLAAFTVGPWSFAVSFSMLGKGQRQRCITRSAVHGRLSDDVVTGSPLCAIAKRLKTAPVPPRLGRGREVFSFVASLRNWRRQAFEPDQVVESFTAISPWAEVALPPLDSLLPRLCIRSFLPVAITICNKRGGRPAAGTGRFIAAPVQKMRGCGP